MSSNEGADEIATYAPTVFGKAMRTLIDEGAVLMSLDVARRILPWAQDYLDEFEDWGHETEQRWVVELWDDLCERGMALDLEVMLPDVLARLEAASASGSEDAASSMLLWSLMDSDRGEDTAPVARLVSSSDRAKLGSVTCIEDEESGA